MAAQCTGINGFSARGEDVWIRFAISSLPVPVSPVRVTVAFEWATCVARSTTSRILGLLAIMSPSSKCAPATTAEGMCFFACCASARLFSRIFFSSARFSSRLSSASFKILSSLSTSTGLDRKSAAPRFIASTAVSTLP